MNRATFFADALLLFDDEPKAELPKKLSEYRWIHCANEGTYKGHHQGEFELTRKVFEAFVRNFRDDPQYRAGTLDGADGEAKSYTGGVRPVIQFDYEHASEMPAFEGSIPTSGAPACGWALEVAIRNGPDGKAQLWAFSHLGEQIRGQIGRGEQRFVSIAFTLTGKHWVTGAPIGPVLTSIAFTNHPFMRDLEPLAAANRGASQPRPSGVKPGGDPAKDPSVAPGEGKSHTEGTPPMTEPVRDQLRERICKTLQLRTLVDDAVVGEAVDEVASKAGNLKALLEALGVAKPEEALKIIPELRSARDKIAGLLGELDALLQQDAAADAAIAKVDIGAAMKARNFQGAGAEKALGAYRAQCVTEEVTKASAALKPGESLTLSGYRAARAKGREHFLAEYGVKDTDKLHLSQPLVAGKGGQQLQPPATSSLPLPIDDRGAGDGIDLSAYRGNTVQRLMAHLSKTEPGFDKLPLERRIQRASEIRRTSLLTQ